MGEKATPGPKAIEETPVDPKAIQDPRDHPARTALKEIQDRRDHPARTALKEILDRRDHPVRMATRAIRAILRNLSNVSIPFGQAYEPRRVTELSLVSVWGR